MAIGSGSTPQLGDRVAVHYSLYYNGFEVESSRDSSGLAARPFGFNWGTKEGNGAIVKGVQEGMAGMQVVSICYSVMERVRPREHERSQGLTTWPDILCVYMLPFLIIRVDVVRSLSLLHWLLERKVFLHSSHLMLLSCESLLHTHISSLSSLRSSSSSSSSSLLILCTLSLGYFSDLMYPSGQSSQPAPMPT